MPSKPMQRSLKHLKDNGWTVAVVEKWIPPRGTMKFGVRRDVFGFGDILACRPANYVQEDKTCETCGYPHSRQTNGQEIALVQTTGATSSGGWFAAHRAKILAIPEFQKWKAAGGIVLLHGWKKRPKDGVRGAKKVWTLKEEIL